MPAKRRLVEGPPPRRPGAEFYDEAIDAGPEASGPGDFVDAIARKLAVEYARSQRLPLRFFGEDRAALVTPDVGPIELNLVPPESLPPGAVSYGRPALSQPRFTRVLLGGF